MPTTRLIFVLSLHSIPILFISLSSYHVLALFYCPNSLLSSFTSLSLFSSSTLCYPSPHHPFSIIFYPSHTHACLLLPFHPQFPFCRFLYLCCFTFAHFILSHPLSAASVICFFCRTGCGSTGYLVEGMSAPQVTKAVKIIFTIDIPLVLLTRDFYCYSSLLPDDHIPDDATGEKKLFR